MKMLKPVIEVQELPPGDIKSRQHLPSLRDLAGPAASPKEAEIIAYLLSGEVCVVSANHGYGTDRIGVRRIREACKSDPRLKGMDRHMGAWMTDGTWIWDGILPYYVAAYHVRLPDEFVRFAEANGWAIDEASIDLDELDTRAYYPGLAAVPS